MNESYGLKTPASLGFSIACNHCRCREVAGDEIQCHLVERAHLYREESDASEEQGDV
jgi:hypothetical protein